MLVSLRRAWTVSAVAARTPTWPTGRRSWRPSPCRRKLWNRLVSRSASTSPVSPRPPSVARPPAPPATPFSTSPRQRVHPSRPPSCRGRDTTTGASMIHWRCGLTAEVSRHAHSPPRQPGVIHQGEPASCGGRSQNKAATVTGDSEGHQLRLRSRPPSIARNCTMLVVLHTDAVRRRRRRMKNEEM